MNDLKLNSYEIFEIGENLDKRLHDDGIVDKSELTVHVSDDQLRKIDEDLFYRDHKGEDDFIPSEGEILVTFKNLTIRIVSNEGELESKKKA